MHYFDSLQQSRAELLARYIVEHACTVRDAATRFGISKSTVHKDVTTELRFKNAALYFQVNEILQKNKKERHLRGGEATRRKYNQKTSKREERREV